MAEVLAKDWKLSTGGAYNAVAGQRDGTMTLTASPVEVTNKDSVNRQEFIAGIYGWTFSASGTLEETDTGLGNIWTAWSTNVSMAGRFTSPAASTYTGTTYVTNHTFSGPYNDVFAFAVDCQGTGALTKA